MTCVPCFLVLAPPYLAPDSSKPSRLPSSSLTCALPHASRHSLDPYTIVGGELLLDGDWLVRVGVGAPCLGGGLPSLLALHLTFWLIQHG